MLHLDSANQAEAVLSGYSATKALARERPEWLEVVKACYEEARSSEEFAGAWVVRRLGRWIPSLRVLAGYGIVERVHVARAGRRAYYRMPDRAGVGRALVELSLLDAEDGPESDRGLRPEA